MVPFAIFLGSSGSIESDWRLVGIALVVAFVTYRLLSAYVARWMNRGAEILTHGELMEAAAAIGNRAGVKLNSVYVFGNRDEREVNAFAGRGGVIAVTRGLVQSLTRRELSAVIGHEVGHLRGKHVTMSSVAFWAYVLLAGPLTGGLVKYAHMPIWVFSLPVMPLAYVFGVTFLSRKNEFNADARAVDLTGDAEAMIASLSRLRKLTRTPVAWGGIQGSILSHPSMRDRVLAIARHAGVSEERALALLQDPDLLEPAPGPLHFDLPAECAGTETVYGTKARMTYLLWIGWAENVFLVAFCLALLFAASRFVTWPLLAPLIVMALIPVIAATYLTLSNWVGRCFIRSIRRKLLRKMGPAARGGTFVGLLPGPVPCPVEGFFQWDAGFIWLTAGELVYRGERTSFSLPRNSVRAISVVKGPLSWDRVNLVRLECDHGSLQLSRPDVGTLPFQAKRLKRRLDDWLQGVGEAASTASEPPPGHSVLHPASTGWMRGWAALRYLSKRAFLLFAGLSLLEPIAQKMKVPGAGGLLLIVPLAYMAINLPYLLRPAPEIPDMRQPEPEAAPLIASTSL